MLDGAQQTKRETQQNNRTLVTRWRTYRLLPPALRKDVDCWVCSEWGSVLLSCPSRVILLLVLRVTRLSRKLLCDRSFAWQDLRLHVVASLHPPSLPVLRRRQLSKERVRVWVIFGLSDRERYI
jgi:hypothetical protein